MPPNILLLILDGVRAKNTSLHGYSETTTPFLSEFSSQSTQYTQARSPSVQSLPSHASIFTGYHLPEHEITSRNDVLEPGHSIWESLNQEHGYATGLFSSNLYLTRIDNGLQNGFDLVMGSGDLPFPNSVDPEQFVHDNDEYTTYDYALECLRSGSPARSLLNGLVVKARQSRPQLLRRFYSYQASAPRYRSEFLDWIDSTESHWAACINFMDTHYPFVPESSRIDDEHEGILDIQDDLPNPPVWEFHSGNRPWWQWSALEGLYDATIQGVDEQIEMLVSGLKDRGEFDDTLIVITSDHGEGFGEFSNVRPGVRIAGHGGSGGLHETVTHVPLLVKRPQQRSGETVHDPVSLTDFPVAVRNVVQHRNSERLFTSDGLVISTSYGVPRRGEEHLGQYGISLEYFPDPIRAVYESGEDGPVKYVVWKDEAATIKIDGTTYMKELSGGIEVVDEVFDEIHRLDIKRNSDDPDSEDLQQQLESLGYL